MKHKLLMMLALIAFTMTAGAQGLSGSGTEADPYLITSTADWNTFASNVNRDNNSNNYYNKFLKLTADITVSEMVGTSSTKFHGTFDGNGYTLTFNKGTAENRFSEEYCAPFRYIFGATIKNLHVAGTIYTSNKFAGVVGSLDAGWDINLSYITACRSSLTINSSVSGDGTHGGFAGIIPGVDSKIYFTDCLFDGQLLGSTTHSCGGFVGWHSGGMVYFTNCLFAPKSVTFDTDKSSTFIRLNGNYSIPNFDHCYYKQTFGTAQGTDASTMDNATLRSNLGATWEIIDGKVVPVMPRHPLTGNGTELSPYQIASATDWNNLVYNVNTYGETYDGKYFKLTANISVTEMVGGGDGSSNVFKGTFDGDGKTITFNVANATEQYIAPFRRIDGATIKGVKLEGTVSSNNRFAGGIVAYAKGTSTVTNCVNSTSITSTYSDENASNGGIVGMVGASGNLTITGCVFNGQMSGTTLDGTWSGILGLCNSGCTANISDCLINIDSDVTGGNTIYRSNGTTNCSNCYYTHTIGNAQGKQARTITAGSNVTVENAGSVTEYNVSGITSYGVGIKYNDVLYAGNADNVSLTLGYSAPGYTATGYTASSGTLTGSSNPYTLTMPDADVTINAATIAAAEWEGTGADWEHAYQIWNSGQLDMLATRVNGANSSNYNTKYYKLMDDISYDDAVANNYTAIGTTIQNQFNHDFNGHFDGQGHTVSGINSVSQWVYYNGLFGKLESGAEVKNVVLANCNIGDGERAGGIAGWNRGLVTDCHITSTVNVNGTSGASAQHGGIVGANEGTISRCIFEGKLTKTFSNPDPENVINAYAYGGIVGINNTNATLNDNLVVDAVIPATMHGYGAVVGLNNGTLTRNYYTACTVNGIANATGVGYATVSGSDIVFGDLTENDGAVPALRDNADNSNAIALMAAASDVLGTYSVQLTGRALFKDGDWNTLCLPFDLNSLDGTPLQGATLMELGNSDACNTGFDASTGTLNLEFVAASKIEAGHAYLVRWGTPESNPGGAIENPVFNGVTVENEDPNGQKVISQDKAVTFQGTYGYQSFTEDNKSILFLGGGNKLYYPQDGASIGAFRAYFTLNLSAGHEVKSFVLNFDEEATSISTPLFEREGSGVSLWYDLNGRKLNGKPSTKGIYINNGRKVVIK